MVSAELCFSLVWFSWYLLYCWFLVYEPGENVLFSAPLFFLESSFQAQSSELMRVWPPARRNVCAVKCKDTWKRQNSKYTCRGMPKNQGAQFITSTNDRLGLRKWTMCKCSLREMRSAFLQVRAHRSSPSWTRHRQLLGWFLLRLCFAQIKTGHLHCWRFSLFGAQIMPCHRGLGWKPKGRSFP